MVRLLCVVLLVRFHYYNICDRLLDLHLILKSDSMVSFAFRDLSPLSVEPRMVRVELVPLNQGLRVLRSVLLQTQIVILERVVPRVNVVFDHLGLPLLGVIGGTGRLLCRTIFILNVHARVTAFLGGPAQALSGPVRIIEHLDDK